MHQTSVNRDLSSLSQYDSQLRRQGLTSGQILMWKKMFIETQREIQWKLEQQIPLEIFGALVNVFKGNNYLSNKRIQYAIAEATELYKEMTLELLDLEDVLEYCKKECDLHFTIHHREYFDELKPEIKISEMKSHSERTLDIVNEVKAELDKALESDPDDSEAYAQYRLLNNLTERFKKDGVLL